MTKTDLALVDGHTYDVIVIGSGVTGGLAAMQLANSGLRVLILEAGPRLDPSESASRREWGKEERTVAASQQPVQSTHSAYWSEDPYCFVNDKDNPYSTDPSKPFIWIRGRHIGGRSLTWGGVTLRFSDHEFRDPDHDGYGPSWPIGYSDLAPFYNKAEQLFCVQGSREGLTQIPDGEYSSPSDMTEMEVGFKREVESKWPGRKVIMSRGISDKSPDGSYQYGWGAKTSLHRTIPAAIATGRTVIRADAVAAYLITDPDSARVKGVAYVDTQTLATMEVFGRIVVLCASTIESVRLMLNSQSSQHPGGLGNSSGMLGKCLMDHRSVAMGGTIDGGESLKGYPLGGPESILIPRFRNIFQDKKSFLRGYGIWGGMQRRKSGAGQAGKTWFLTSLMEVLPRDSNKITISDNEVDAWGIRTAQIDFEYGHNEHAMAEDARQCMIEMISTVPRLNMMREHTTLPGQYVHELGGARMGKVPSLSVLNMFNQCWDAKNLFVLDGACFVTTGWQNPTLTMMALTLRACEFIVDSMKRGDV